MVSGGDGYGIPIDTDNSGTADYLEADVFGSNASYMVNGGYDITSATLTQSLSVTKTGPSGIRFNNDGTKMFVIGSTGVKFMSTSYLRPLIFLRLPLVRIFQ